MIQQELFVELGQHPGASRKDESLEQGRRRATRVRRVDSRSKDGEGQRHNVGRGPMLSFGRAGDASVGVTDWTEVVRSFLEKKTAEHSVLLERIPAVPDLQSALLLLFCVAARASLALHCATKFSRPSITLGRGSVCAPSCT